MFQGSAVAFGAGDPYMYCFNDRDQSQACIPHPSTRAIKRAEEHFLEQIIHCCDRFFAVSIFICGWVVKADDSPYR